MVLLHSKVVLTEFNGDTGTLRVNNTKSYRGFIIKAKLKSDHTCLSSALTLIADIHAEEKTKQTNNNDKKGCLKLKRKGDVMMGAA